MYYEVGHYICHKTVNVQKALISVVKYNIKPRNLKDYTKASFLRGRYNRHRVFYINYKL
jgi:hypothetical protein